MSHYREGVAEIRIGSRYSHSTVGDKGNRYPRGQAGNQVNMEVVGGACLWLGQDEAGGSRSPPFMALCTVSVPLSQEDSVHHCNTNSFSASSHNMTGTTPRTSRMNILIPSSLSPLRKILLAPFYIRKIKGLNTLLEEMRVTFQIKQRPLNSGAFNGTAVLMFQDKLGSFTSTRKGEMWRLEGQQLTPNCIQLTNNCLSWV